jgi:hypothetical protein
MSELYLSAGLPTDLEVAEERVHEQVEYDEGREHGVQDAHEHEPAA